MRQVAALVEKMERLCRVDAASAAAIEVLVDAALSNSKPPNPQAPQRRRYFAHGARQVSGSYTVSQIIALIPMSRRTFFRLRATGKLPFLAELMPRVGRLIRYRCDLVDRYLAGQFQRLRVASDSSRSVEK